MIIEANTMADTAMISAILAGSAATDGPARPQHLIPGGMTETIVHFLEPIQIENGQRSPSQVGANLFQSAFTNWCPMMAILEKGGLKRAA